MKAAQLLIASAIFLFASCATTQRPSALLGDPREQGFLHQHISDEELHSAFREAQAHEAAGHLDGEISESVSCQLHAYLNVVGDRRFAAALLHEPKKVQRTVSFELYLPRLQHGYPETVRIAQSFARPYPQQ